MDRFNDKYLTLPTRLSADPITSNEFIRRSSGLPGVECTNLSEPILPLCSPAMEPTKISKTKEKEPVRSNFKGGAQVKDK